MTLHECLPFSYKHLWSVNRLACHARKTVSSTLMKRLDLQDSITPQGRWSEDERNSEGPAARAVRNLEQQVAAAAEKATTGSVDMPQDERRREQS